MKQLKPFLVFMTIFLINPHAWSQIDSFQLHGDISITIDRPTRLRTNKKTIIVFFALPNGNTTAQTMGKTLLPGDDWHYDIQHIRAQTAFIRDKMPATNFVVIYLGNKLKSWPAWKQKHAGFRTIIPKLVDSLASSIPGKRKAIYLSGHSGGGSFIFGYLAGVEYIPAAVKRISFLDSNYGYDSTYYPKLSRWLLDVKGASLNVFAYNDSIARYNGKPVVSPTGGTWYRSRLMLKHFRQDFAFEQEKTDSIESWRSRSNRLHFFFKPNLNRGIYHTQQVELNGFIHSVFCGTRHESIDYVYYSKRAYAEYIR